jgi:glutamate N-acetyltransferase/amino-acid N-acetyltransferase
VDGDTSTNDTVLILANGASGVAVEDRASLTAFREALIYICLDLAQSIVRDGEGVTKFISLQVTGAREEGEAVRVARAIATSPLVKTAFAGGDPNWGRILAAAGRAGVDLDPDRLTLWIGEGEVTDLQLVRDGTPTAYDESHAVRVFATPEIAVRLDLGMGGKAVTIWTCDLTHEYVNINSEYRT